MIRLLSAIANGRVKGKAVAIFRQGQTARLTSIGSIGRNYEVIFNMNEASFDYPGATAYIERFVGNASNIVRKPNNKQKERKLK
jgi:hypothetical protein